MQYGGDQNLTLPQSAEGVIVAVEAQTAGLLEKTSAGQESIDMETTAPTGRIQIKAGSAMARGTPADERREEAPRPILRSPRERNDPAGRSRSACEQADQAGQNFPNMVPANHPARARFVRRRQR